MKFDSNVFFSTLLNKLIPIANNAVGVAALARTFKKSKKIIFKVKSKKININPVKEPIVLDF